MAQHTRQSSFHASTSDPSQTGGKSYFEQQRELLVGEVAQSLELVLQNLNKLNRALEEVIAVGNEFSPVEALWSHFEGVMAQPGGPGQGTQGQQQEGGGGGGGNAGEERKESGGKETDEKVGPHEGG